MATLENLTRSIEELGSAFEEFKSSNEEELKQIKEKGSSDPLLQEKLSKLNDRIDTITAKKEELYEQLTEHKTSFKELYDRVEGMETALKRPGHGGDKPEFKSVPLFEKYLRVREEYKHTVDHNELKEALVAAWLPILGSREKALSVIDDSAGGTFVSPTVNRTVLQRIFDSTPVRQLATVIMIGSDAYEQPVDDDEAASGWVGEIGTRSETNTPDTAALRIPVHEQYAEPRITQKLLDDAFFNVEDWLGMKVSDKISREENTAYATGNGVVKPRGFLSYTNGTAWNQVEQIESGTSATFKGDDLVDTYFALQAGYARNATWMMKRSTVKHVRKLKDGQGNYIWEPGLAGNVPNTILGAPYQEGEDIEAIGASKKVAVIADWKQFYYVIDRIGIRVLRDPYTAKPFVKFYTTKRTGGGVAQGRAGKILVCKA